MRVSLVENARLTTNLRNTYHAWYMPSMDNVSVRELRNNGGRVLQRVANGETLTVTMDGQPIAELRPVAGRGVPEIGRAHV